MPSSTTFVVSANCCVNNFLNSGFCACTSVTPNSGIVKPLIFPVPCVLYSYCAASMYNNILSTASAILIPGGRSVLFKVSRYTSIKST